MRCSAATVLALAAGAAGTSYPPGAPEYLNALAGNGVDCPLRCPDDVVLPSSAADVVAAVRRAKAANSSVAVRCGGHSMWCQWARGSGTLIDLRPLQHVAVEEHGAAKVVRVGGGATFYEILPALHKQGVQVLHGMVKNVGLGGITLGGGYHVELTPYYGWAVDSILGFTLVTPGGSLVHVNETGTEVVDASPLEPDPAALVAGNWLWWAVKGSWSSFGAVVEFELVGHPYPKPTMDFMAVDAFLNISGALDAVSRPPAGWSCTLLSAPVSLWPSLPPRGADEAAVPADAAPPPRARAPLPFVPDGLRRDIVRRAGLAAGGPAVRTEAIMGCTKLSDDAEPATMGKLMRQYGVHTLTGDGIPVPVPLKLFESFQPCEGRHGGKLLGFGLLIGTEQNLTAATEIMNDIVSARWAPAGELWGVILGGGGGFELKSRTALGWPAKPIFVALGGGKADTVISWVNKMLPVWRQTVGARVYPNWGDCSLKDFGHAYWGDNYESLVAYKKAVDPTSVFRGIQLVGQGDTKCWADDDESGSDNCKAAGVKSQASKAMNEVWSAVVKDCKKKVPYHPAPPPARREPRLAAPPQGPWAVEADTFTVGGLVAKGSQKASVWQPLGPPPRGGFPVVSFAHGAPVGGPVLLPQTYGPLLSALASWGFVVVAPDSCVPPTGWSCYPTLYKDQLHVITAAKAEPSIHPAFARANFSRVGVIGHSYGADATVTAAGPPGAAAGVAAAVVLHPAHDADAADVAVPAMVVTGSDDMIAPPADAAWVYGRIPARPKLLLELKGATHMEPTTVPVEGRNRMSPSLTMFLACHLHAWNAADGCAFVYGDSGDAVCTRNLTFTPCNVTQ